MKDLLWNKNIFIIPDGFIFDIQRFASADSEGRTEKATEYKKRKARDEGRVALSKDLSSTIVTLLSFVTLYFLAGYFYKVLIDVFVYFFENIDSIELDDPRLFYDFFLFPFLKIFLPIAIVASFTAIFSNYIQIGFKITFKAIKPNYKKINFNIFKFFQEQVLSPNGFFNLLKSIVKVAIIGFVGYLSISGSIDELRNTLFVDNLFYPFIFIAKLVFSLVLKTLIILMIFSILDVLFVRWHYEESLRMKKEEIKEEYKELYGDPNVKQRLKQMYQNILSQKKMLEEVPKADVVITNPTHFAVALYYDRYIDEAPRVIAKGKDAFAQKIKEVAKENEIFMYENVALARSLYSDVEVNDIIPRPMYGLVINAYKLAMEHKEKVS